MLSVVDSINDKTFQHEYISYPSVETTLLTSSDVLLQSTLTTGTSLLPTMSEFVLILCVMYYPRW